MCFETTVCFATVTLGAVALHGVTETTGKRKADSVVWQIVGQVEKLCPVHADLFPVLEQLFDVHGALYPLMANKTLGMSHQ